MKTPPRDPSPAPVPADATRPDERLLLRSPDALIAALPYLLGFRPQESAVIIWLQRDRILLTQRLDLLERRDDLLPWLAAVWGHAAAPLADELILVLVTERPDVADIAGHVLEGAEERELLVRDALRVGSGRWWSLLCTDPACCGPQGRPVDEAAGAAVAAEFALMGRAPFADREALVRSMTADPGGVESVGETVQSTVELTARLPRRSLERWRNRTIEEVLSTFARAARCDGQSRPLGPADVATVVAGLRDVRVRDTVLWECARMAVEQRMAALGTLTTAIRCAPVGCVAPVATCCALVAWLAGDGAHASVAVERALADDPAYSLALLLAQALSAGLPPESWRQATSGLTRAECRHGSAPAEGARPLAC